MPQTLLDPWALTGQPSASAEEQFDDPSEADLDDEDAFREDDDGADLLDEDLDDYDYEDDAE